MEARRRATYDDLLALPDHVIGEIVNGELHVSPRPAPRHSVASSVVGARINTRYHLGEGGPGGWWVLDEPALHLQEHVLVPDTAGWRRETSHIPTDTAYHQIRPDWICEVLSRRQVDWTGS